MGTAISPTDRSGGRYRLVVLGGGPAGIAAARAAVRRCGCLALVLPEAARPDAPKPAASGDFVEQIRRIQARSGTFAALRPPEAPGIDVYLGQPVFAGKRTLTVDGRELHFRKAIIATGAATAPAEIDGADRNYCLWPRSLAELSEPPRRLAVVGCGPDGCHWAQAFRGFGSQVHLIGRHRGVLPDEDPDAAAVLQARLEADGVRLHLGCDELGIEKTGNLRAVLMGRAGEREKLLVDRVLLCGPRRANTAGLGLEAATIAHTGHGIITSDRLRTTNRHVFAAGAVCGLEFDCPQAAEATARLAVRNALCFTTRRLGRLVVPHCIHTRPAVARAGLTPQRAAAEGIEIDTYRVDLSEADESIAPSRREGFVAVHVRRRRGRVVGATVAAEDADELIAPLVLLIARRLCVAALSNVVGCRPSRLEVFTRLALMH